jgi:hypothetical protein
MKEPTIEQCSPVNYDLIMQNKANLKTEVGRQKVGCDFIAPTQLDEIPFIL